MIRQVLLRNITDLASQSGLPPIKRLRALWPVLLEAPVGTRTRPEAIEGDQLIVLVESRVLAGELNLHSRRLCNLIHRHNLLPELSRIRQIVSRVAPAGTFPPPRATRRPPRGPSEEPVSEPLESALTRVPDPGLRDTLERLCRFRNDDS